MVSIELILPFRLNGFAVVLRSTVQRLKAEDIGDLLAYEQPVGMPLQLGSQLRFDKGTRCWVVGIKFSSEESGVGRSRIREAVKDQMSGLICMEGLGDPPVPDGRILLDE